VLWLARKEDLTVTEVLRRLAEAGLGSLPGGGAEILVDAVRRRVSPAKITVEEWLAVMRAAQEMGLSTTATMVYGLGESPAERVEHLLRVRDLQDETGGFRAFIPWSYQPGRTRLGGEAASGPEYLRMVALARLVLDNVPNLQAGWVTEGPELAAAALHFGANDLGGVLMEEVVVRATGVSHSLDAAGAVRLIRAAGFLPVQRDTLYRTVRVCAEETP
jgi:cyclic dehypoxanthinyl futalosine synthase